MKRPAFQFYPADWRKDVELQSCSMAAQGLWINAMCVFHECEPYGHLTVNGKGMNVAQLGRQVGLSAKEAQALLDELLDAGVARKTPEGVIYSKRMVEDEDLRNRRAEGGKAGSEHGAKGAEHGKKGGRPPTRKGGLETPPGDDSKPPPSSSSSTSVKENTARKRATPPPDGVDPQVWADWLQLRKTKRAPVTATVIDGAKVEAAKAGMTLDDFLRVWCRRGSQGLEAEWLKPHEVQTPDAPPGRPNPPKVRDIFAVNER